MPLTPIGIETLPSVAPRIDIGVAGETWGVVFAGGIGSRFWPLSSPERPKPTLRLLGDRSLISDTIERLAPAIPPERVLIVTARDIAGPVAAAAPQVPRDNVLVEPRPLGTAAALAWALRVIETRGGARGVACAIHADLAAGFPDQFRGALESSIAMAVDRRALVALGVPPTRPESGFGYLLAGDPLDPTCDLSRGGACRVARFVEKPGLDVLTDLLTRGALWHAGVVVGRVADFNDELAAHTVEIAHGADALRAGNLPAFAASVRSVSVERGLLERTENLLMKPVECAWDDVGTWASVGRASDLDDRGNGAIGTAHFVDSASNVVHSESGTVVLFGCQKMLVVTLPGLTFVTPLDKAADLKALLDHLPANLREYSPPSSRPPS